MQKSLKEARTPSPSFEELHGFSMRFHSRSYTPPRGVRHAILVAINGPTSVDSVHKVVYPEYSISYGNLFAQLRMLENEKRVSVYQENGQYYVKRT